MKTDKQKLEAILELLTDKTVGRVSREQDFNDDERHGAFVLIGDIFSKAYKIANSGS